MAVGLAAGCAVLEPRSEILITGSDTMLELNRRLAEEFMRAHPGVAVRVEGGGTGAGVEALVAGRVDLCAASRPFTPDEVASLHRRFATLGVRVLVARDALSVYLHPSNPVTDLRLDDLRRVFSGAVASWEELGGRNTAVLPVVRPPSSGTYRFFRDHVLRDLDYATTARTAVRTRDVEQVVGRNPAAIGYGAIVYGRDLVHCRIDGVAPSVESVRNGRYPLARYLYFYAAEPPHGPARDFTDWCVGPAGQTVVAEVGFVPLWAPAVD
jgi:phosphate transport system substrate-binding protein